jgi:hypothetical protein
MGKDEEKGAVIMMRMEQRTGLMQTLVSDSNFGVGPHNNSLLPGLVGAHWKRAPCSPISRPTAGTTSPEYYKGLVWPSQKCHNTPQSLLKPLYSRVAFGRRVPRLLHRARFLSIGIAYLARPFHSSSTQARPTCCAGPQSGSFLLMTPSTSTYLFM